LIIAKKCFLLKFSYLKHQPGYQRRSSFDAINGCGLLAVNPLINPAKEWKFGFSGAIDHLVLEKEFRVFRYTLTMLNS
jgi:hypothetical protein